MSVSTTSFDIRKVVAFAATPTVPQVITNIGDSLVDADVRVYGTDALGTGTLISSDFWSFNTARDTLTLTHTVDYTNVLIVIDAEIKQPLDYERDTSFLPTVLESQLDRLTLCVAWLRDRFNNVLSFDDTDETPPAGDLGTAASRALKFIGFDSSGDMVMTSIDLTLTEDLSALATTADNIIMANVGGTAWEVQTPAQVRTRLGLVVSTDIQAYDAALATWSAYTAAEIARVTDWVGLTDAEVDRVTALAAITPTLDTILLGDGSDWVQFNEAAFKAQFDLEAGTDFNAYDANVAGMDQGVATTDSPTFAAATVTGLSTVGSLTAGANVVSHVVVAAGLYTWGNTDWDNEIATGIDLLATDIIHCNIETNTGVTLLLRKAENLFASDEIGVFLNGAGNALDVIAWSVLRAI